MAVHESVSISHQTEEEREIPVECARGEILLIFDVHINKKYGVQKPHVINLTIDRTRPARVRDITEHLETQLLLPGGHGRRLLLQAICNTGSSSSSNSVSAKVGWVVPLVCDQLWAQILQQYPHSQLKILVDQNRSLVMTHNRSCSEWLFGQEVRIIDIKRYLPTKNLKASNIMDLCNAIFERRLKIKPHLRKGVWMHLVGVFPPELTSREQRIQYVEQLRMIYDSLKGKWKGEQGERSSQVQQLVEAVHRDAVRTDPTHPFYTRGHTATESLSPDSISNCNEESNIQKLVNIITIYILEHDGVSYTQGMTDLLSPFLYVMNREADAYICFAAMVERIKSHFNTWCEGTLHKIERLRHICEVLDPELYHFLANKIEEDAFALFFGMVLIECRREFSFDDSFHLLEATWAGVTCMKNCLSPPITRTRSEWAHFMTYQSREVIQQVFGETQSPYSAHPLPSSFSNTGAAQLSFSRHSSLQSQGSLVPERILTHQLQSAMPNLQRMSASTDDEESSPALSINRSENLSAVHSSPPIHSSGIYQNTPGTTTVVIENNDPGYIPELRPRSYTDPSLQLFVKQNDVAPVRCVSQSPARRSVSPTRSFSHSHSESELYDSFSNNKVSVNGILGKPPTEMTDLSSVSSGTISSTNGNFNEKSTKQSVSSSQGRMSSSTDRPPTAESFKVNHSNHSSLSSPEPDFNTPTDFVDGHKDLLSTAGHATSSSGYSSRDKKQSSPSSTTCSPSSNYQTAVEESSTGQSSNSQSPLRSRVSRPRRVVRKGERITTESVPDETHLCDDRNGHQTTSDQSTPVRRPRMGDSSYSYRTPKKIEGSGRYGEDDEQNPSRITPVKFFDTIEQIASSVPGTATNSGQFSVGGQALDENDGDDNVFLSDVQRNMRATSDVSLIMSQLVSSEQAGPRVTRENSLEIPVSDCFPLFVCMSILAQHRAQIMQRNVDFVGLSVILNSQAGRQDVNKTLYVARDLYRIYRSYQAACFEGDPNALNTWLDDDRVGDDDRDEGEQRTGDMNRQNSRDSLISDSVFANDQ